jgi:acyl carrier protein
MTVEESIKQISSKILHRTDLDFSEGVTFKQIGADSLDVVQIIVAIEDKYDIELADEELAALTNVKEFVGLVDKKVKEKG